MIAPSLWGRAHPGRKVLRSVQARAAVESVLVAAYGRNLAFPVKAEYPTQARHLWHVRLDQLRAAGWRKIQPGYRLGIARRCPWGLLGLDRRGRGKVARRCQLHGCPSCHGHKSALLADRILRCVAGNPTANLRLIVEDYVIPLAQLPAFLELTKEMPDPGASGCFREVTVEPVSLNTVRFRAAYLLVGPSNSRRGKRVKTTRMGLVKAVARMRPYAASYLECEWDKGGHAAAALLNLLSGMRLSSCTGVARVKGGAARTLRGCAKVFLTDEPRPPEPVPRIASSDDGLLLDGDEGLTWEEADPDVETFDESEYALPELYHHTRDLTRAEMVAEMDAREAEWAAKAAEEETWVEDGSALSDPIVADESAEDVAEYLASRAYAEAEDAEAAGLETGANATLICQGVADYYSTLPVSTSGRERRKLAPRAEPTVDQLIHLSPPEILRRVPLNRNSPSLPPFRSFGTGRSLRSRPVASSQQ